MPLDDGQLRILALALAVHVAGVKATVPEVIADAQEIYLFMKGSVDPATMN